MTVYVVTKGFYREIERVHASDQSAWDWVAETIALEAQYYRHWDDFEESEATEYHVDEWVVHP